MRKATLLTVMVLLGLTFSMAREVTLGPDLRYVVEKKSTTRTTQESVTPWSHKVELSSEVGAVTSIMDRENNISSLEMPNSTEGATFESLLEYVNWGGDGFSYGGFGFDATDSALTWFRPSTEAKITQAHIIFSDDSDWSGATARLELYSIKADWQDGNGDGEYDFSQLDWVVGDDGPHDSLLWFVNIPVVDVGINFTYTIDLPDGGYDIGSSDFALVLGIPANVPGGQIYYSPFWSDRGQYHSFKYYHGAAGWKSRLNFIMMATVDYYGDPPPFISDELDLDDVYLSDDPGPYEVSANIYDTGTASFTGALTYVGLEYSINGDMITLDLSSQIATVTDSVFTAEFAGLAVGDYVEYSWMAIDNGSTNPDGGVDHPANSALPMGFTVREANPDASILIMDDNGNELAADYYAPILAAGGWIYDYWNTDVSGSPTAGILANYNTLIWAQGNEGDGILADAANETILAAYLDAGGNLFLSSSDYISTFAGIWEVPDAGSFLETHLHVAEFVSDANVGPVSGVSDDTLYIGVTGSVVSDDYSLVEFEVHPGDIGFSNWADEVVPTTDAEAPFMVFSNYLDEDWVEAGVLFDGTYKMIFLPWQFEAVSDDEIRFDLMANFLAFFNELAAPVVTAEGGNRYAQAANAGDVMVYGSATDGDGTVVSMAVDYTLDFGTTWSSVAMTGGVATIPALALNDTMTYFISATDNDGLIGYSDDFDVWKVDFTPVGNILYVGDDYYDWHYGWSVDGVASGYVASAVANASMTVDTWDVDEMYLMDAGSVLGAYDAVIWHGYGDWDGAYFPANTFDNPLSSYDGHILYSSEEMFGTWTDWSDVGFGPGETAYDVLGISWVGNDYDPIDIAPNTASYLGAGLDTLTLVDEIIVGTDTSTFIWLYGDIFDPAGYPGPYADEQPFSGDIGPAIGAPSYWYDYTGIANGFTYTLGFSFARMPEASAVTMIENFLGTVSIDQVSSIVPNKYALGRNYPNPFNPSTTIAFDVPTSNEVMITVYNVLGQKVLDLVNDQYSAGSYNVTWNGLDAAGIPVSSGIYMYKMTSGDFTSTSKMLYLR
jgi:hypothetical protein